MRGEVRPLVPTGQDRADWAASVLTDAQRDEIGRLLVARIQDLAVQARNLRELRQRVCPPAGGVDAVRRMLDAHLDVNRQEFMATLEALQGIDDEGLGRCTECGSPIAFAALERAPMTTRCSACTRDPFPSHRSTRRSHDHL
jgi:hypothetical protein